MWPRCKVCETTIALITAQTQYAWGCMIICFFVCMLFYIQFGSSVAGALSLNLETLDLPALEATIMRVLYRTMPFNFTLATCSVCRCMLFAAWAIQKPQSVFCLQVH